MDYNFLGYWGNALNDTSVLITMTILDTILGISWRVKKRRPIISNVFLSGLIKNLGCSLLPAFLHVISIFSNDNTLLNITIPIIGFGIFAAILQSIVANAVLCGVKIPESLKKWYDRLFYQSKSIKKTVINNKIAAL